MSHDRGEGLSLVLESHKLFAAELVDEVKVVVGLVGGPEG
jgi:hypothetical protein